MRFDMTSMTSATGCTSVPAAVAQWARTTPDRAACVFVRADTGVRTTEIRISYAELDGRVRAAAAGLLGVAAPGDRLVLLLPPGPEYLVAFLGCLLAGIVAVPLYPPRPGARLDRIAAVVADCQASGVLTTTAGRDRCRRDETFTRPAIPLYVAERVLAGQRPPPTEPPRPELLAFLQYTSGSTGRPKGVMVSHRNLMDNARAIAAGFGIRADDVVVSWLPMYHDMGLVGTALLPLVLGLTAVFLDTIEFVHDPLSWLRALHTYQGTCSGGPDFGYRLLVDRYDPGRLDGVDLSAWRIAFNGAEPVDHRTMDRFVAVYGRHGFRSEALLPCYGLAEATLFVAGTEPGNGYHAERFDRDALDAGRLVPAGPDGPGRTLVSCGRPADDTVVVIRDRSGRPAPDGVIGEIGVRGPGVADGYWGDPAATAAVFRVDVAGTGTPYLGTGDLGATYGDRLYVVGRVKDLIILAGRNVHPQDIEAAARTAAAGYTRPGGAAAFQLDNGDVILALEVRGGEAARWRDRADAAATMAAAIRREVARECSLSELEIVLVGPGVVPRTSSGKVRRSEARARLLARRLDVVWRSSIASPPVPDADPPGGIADVLRREVAARTGGVVPPEDEVVPLAALGLDSLALVALKQAIERRLGLALDPAMFHGDRSIAQIAVAITAGRPVPSGAPTQAPSPGDGPNPMSEGQIHLLFYDRLHPDDVANNLTFAVRFDRPFAPDRLCVAVTSAVARHPALRTTFATGRRTSTVHPDASFDWAVRYVDRDDATLTREYFATIAYRRFDLGAGPLVRAAAVVAPDATTLLLVGHHAVVDYWSLRIVAAQIIGALLGSDPVPPTVPAAEAAQWAAAQARTAGSEPGRARLAALADRWYARRDDVLLPPRPPGSRRHNPAGYTDLEIGPEATRRLYGYVRARGMTPFAGVATAFLRALHVATGRDRLAVGVPYHGRAAAEFAGTVGYLVNLVPLPGDFGSGTGTDIDIDIDQLADRTWRSLRAALADADVPLAHLIRALLPARHGYPPLFQATLTFQQSADGLLDDGFAVPWTGHRQRVGGVGIEAFDVPPRDAAFPLALYGARVSDRLAFRLIRQYDAVDADLAGRIVAALHDGLLALDPGKAANP